MVLLFAIPLAAIAAAIHRLTPLRHRIALPLLGWILALGPLAATIGVLSTLGEMPRRWEYMWIPAANLSISFQLDGLSALFALLVTGIGTLIVVYAGYYFKGEEKSGRFLAYILLFMTSMLGLVMAGDVLTMFIFWEGTSITSFLLVAYKYEKAEARAGAFKALFITGGGGIALLAGLLFVGHVAGGMGWDVILTSGDLLRGHELYPLMMLLVAFGAMTKSAQFPGHIWLPDAMSAPTPASAYLHSATMVKAGIYLLARLNPALGQTELWFWLLSTMGLVTMLVGAYVGVRQRDLKALLAYSTISQLGALVMLIGQDTEIAFKALVVGIVAHALYKSALFLVVGTIDHEAGTRDLDRLGAIRREMPRTAAVGLLAALSLAGLPPLFGFLAKETLLATTVHPSLPEALAWVFPAAVVASGALILVQALIIAGEGLLGRRRDETIHPHEAPWPMWLAPGIPAVISLGLGLLPEPPALASFLAEAAGAAHGTEVKVSLALWTGLNIPLFLSVVAVTLGVFLFVGRERLWSVQERLGGSLSTQVFFKWAMRLIDGAADAATALQHGRLRTYLAIIVVSMSALVFWLSAPTLELPADLLQFTDFGWIPFLRAVALLLTVGAALGAVFLRRDFFAILALGIAGFGVALYMILEPAPDVALVQLVVDILAMVIFVLALTRLPRPQRRRAQELNDAQSRPGVIRDALVALSGGAVITLLTLVALTERPRSSSITPFVAENAKPLVGAADMVGAILVDFRAIDTLIEIAVFAMAGLGVYTLLRYAARPEEPEEEAAESPAPPWPTLGISGASPSAFLRFSAAISLPLTLVIGFVHVIFGHDQSGDGFTAGVIVSLAVAYWYVIFGYEGVRQRLTWLRPGWLMGGGLLLAITGAAIGAWLGDGFFAHVNMGEMIGVSLPPGVLFSTSLLFEAAIALTVLGSVSFMLNTLGRPQDVPVPAGAPQNAKPSVAGVIPKPHAPAATSDAAPATKS